MRCDDNSIRQSVDISVFIAFVAFRLEEKWRKKKIHFRSHRPKKKEDGNDVGRNEAKVFSLLAVSMDFMDAICAPDAFALNGWRWRKENRNLYSGSDFQSTNTTYFQRTIWTGKTIYIERWNVRSSAAHDTNHRFCTSIQIGAPSTRCRLVGRPTGAPFIVYVGRACTAFHLAWKWLYDAICVDCVVRRVTSRLGFEVDFGNARAEWNGNIKNA